MWAKMLGSIRRGPPTKLRPTASARELGGEGGIFGAGDSADFDAGSGHVFIVASEDCFRPCQGRET